MESEENRDLLLEYGTGKPGSLGSAAFARHLEECSACQGFVAGRRTVWAALDKWEAPAISADFNRQLHQRIEQEVSWWDKLSHPLRPLLAWNGLPVAAAAGLVITVGLMFQHPAGVTPQAETIRVEALQPEQVVNAIEDLEMLDKFDRGIRADAARPQL
jgi:predicted anti-sigma-YlaC factor YlaD